MPWPVGAHCSTGIVQSRLQCKSCFAIMTTLKVLTLNVWGIHYLAQRIRERLGYIAEGIKQYDIVGLQEVWSRKDYDFLLEQLQLHFPYSHHTHRGILGSGLCVFSRYPIVSTHTHLFYVNGSLAEIKDGEIFVGKGIMFCRVQTPSGHIAFYNTHTNPRNRDSQMFEVYQFVDQTRGTLPVILLGDFNTKPRHLAYAVLTECLRLEDVYQDDPVDTCDRVSNIFTLKRMTPKRIDFVLYSDKSSSSHALELKHHQLALSGHIPGKSFPYSDHEGVEAVFQLTERKHPTVPPSPKLPDEAIQVFQKIADNMEAHKNRFQISTNQVLCTFAILFLFSVLVTFVLSNHALFLFLASYNVHWLSTGLVGLTCALCVVGVFHKFDSVTVLNALEANLSEVRTLLKYQSTLKE